MNTRGTCIVKSIRFAVTVSGFFAIVGCSSMNINKINRAAPEFDFVSYFEGHRRASGWFADRFGKVRRHFCGDFIGTVRPDGVFELDEKLIYSDGVVETRLWEVTISSDGRFSAVSDSLVGKASGVIKGNALNMQYVMNVLIAPEKTWKLSMDDYMFLQPDGSLHNITQVKKFGVRIGSVSTQYHRPLESELADDSSCVSAPTSATELASVLNF